MRVLNVSLTLLYLAARWCHARKIADLQAHNYHAGMHCELVDIVGMRLGLPVGSSLSNFVSIPHGQKHNCLEDSKRKHPERTRTCTRSRSHSHSLTFPFSFSVALLVVNAVCLEVWSGDSMGVQGVLSKIPEGLWDCISPFLNVDKLIFSYGCMSPAQNLHQMGSNAHQFENSMCSNVSCLAWAVLCYVSVTVYRCVMECPWVEENS